MEENSNQFENLLKRLEDYGNANIELYKHIAVDKFSTILSTLLTYRIIIVSIVLFAVIFSLGVALWLGEVLGKLYYGIFIISGVYGIVALVLYSMREKIRQRICDSIISNSFN